MYICKFVPQHYLSAYTKRIHFKLTRFFMSGNIPGLIDAPAGSNTEVTANAWLGDFNRLSHFLQRTLLLFLPVQIRAASRRWHSEIADRTVVITIDSRDIVTQKARIQAFLGTWHGHVSLKFTDFGLPNQGDIVWLPNHNYSELEDGWWWVYGIARSVTNAKTLAIDFSGLMSHSFVLSSRQGTSADRERRSECLLDLFQSVAPIQPSSPGPTIVGFNISNFQGVAWDMSGQPGTCPNLLRFLFRNAKTLRKLDLSKCVVIRDQLFGLIPHLGDALEELVLDKNWPSGPPAGWAESMAKALQRMGDLKTFSMNHCGLRAADLTTFGAALVDKQHLMTLNLSKNCNRNKYVPHGVEDWDALGQYLSRMPSLVALDISGIKMTTANVSAVVQALSTFNTAHLACFRELDLSALTFEVADIQSLLLLLKKMTGLKKLKLNELKVALHSPDGTRISSIDQCGEDVLQGLSEALEGMTELEVLSLSQITERRGLCFQWLARGLTSKAKLRLLDLSKNRMGVEAFRGLATCFPALKGLRDLYLNRNMLGNERLPSLLPILEDLKARGIERITLWKNGRNAHENNYETRVELPKELAKVCFTHRDEFMLRFPYVDPPYMGEKFHSS